MLYNIRKQLKNHSNYRQKALEKFVMLFNHLKKHPRNYKKHPLIEIKNKCLFQLSLDSTFNKLLSLTLKNLQKLVIKLTHLPSYPYNYIEKQEEQAKKQNLKGDKS